MIQFQPITLKDEATIRSCLALSPSKQLINCFEAFYLWREVLRIEYARYGGFAIFRVHYDPSGPRYLFPFGRGERTWVWSALREYCHKQGHPVRLAKVRGDQLRQLQEMFPGQLTAAAQRDHAEYLYEADTFRFYRGRDLQSKRNYVNYAHHRYPWSYEELKAENLPEARAFAASFHGEGSFGEDNAALSNALRDYGTLQLTGGIIRIDSAVAALFICAGLANGETAAGLFLRGDHTRKGIIPLMYQEFFRAHPEFRFFNFGEDLGVEGLRKNKLSFKPMELLELHEVNFL